MLTSDTFILAKKAASHIKLNKVKESLAQVDLALNGRKMTAGEINMAKSIFKDSLDYDSIDIHSIPKMEVVHAITPCGNIFFSSDYYEDDFSGKLKRKNYKSDNELYKRKTFIHELVHVWQFEGKYPVPVVGASIHWFNCGGGTENSYNYLIDTTKKFTTYRMEQQAQIICDYFAIVNHPKSRYVDSLCKLQGKSAYPYITHEILRSYYEMTLKDFLINPNAVKKDLPLIPPKTEDQTVYDEKLNKI